MTTFGGLPPPALYHVSFLHALTKAFRESTWLSLAFNNNRALLNSMINVNCNRFVEVKAQSLKDSDKDIIVITFVMFSNYTFNWQETLCML